MGKICEKLVEFTSKTQFSDLPHDVVHETKRVLLDSIGCAVGALLTDAGKSAVELARRLGGPRESTIIGTSDRVSCANAAFANGELINALDYDAGAVGHDTPYVIGASLGAIESAQASGKDLLLAIALGHEISTRLIRAEGGYREAGGWASATIAAAASSSKVLNLNQEQMANAIGIAGYVCPPNALRKHLDTSPVRMTKYHVSGWGAHGGVISALLAEMGFTGDTDLFEGEECFWKFTGHKQWNAESVLEGLGTKWIHKISYKQYPVGF